MKTKIKNVKVLNYNGYNIRIALYRSGVWFVLRDVCTILELSNMDQLLDMFAEGDVIYADIADPADTRKRYEYYFVNESSLWIVLFQADKRKASLFNHWITNEVLSLSRKQDTCLTSDVIGSDIKDKIQRTWIDYQNRDLRKEWITKRTQVLQKWSQKLNNTEKLLLCTLLELKRTNTVLYSSSVLRPDVKMDYTALGFLTDLILGTSADMPFGDSSDALRQDISDEKIREYLEGVSNYMKED
jgi:prophage antirepressor-like protein